MGAVFYLSGRYMQPVQIEYRFELPGQGATCFRLAFDRETMAPLTPCHEPAPFGQSSTFIVARTARCRPRWQRIAPPLRGWQICWRGAPRWFRMSPCV